MSDNEIKTVSEAQKRASKKYLEGLDELKVRMPKGKGQRVKDHAAKNGESVNGFVNRAIDEAMEREKQND